MPHKSKTIQLIQILQTGGKYYLLLPSRKTSSTCSAHMLCLEMGCRGGSNRRTQVHASPSHLLQPSSTCRLSQFAIAVKPEGGGSEDGSDMEAEPGIPLKVNPILKSISKPNSQIHLKPQFPNPLSNPYSQIALKPQFSNPSLSQLEPSPFISIPSPALNESHLAAQAAEVSNDVHGLPAGRAGEGLREDPVPGHLHQGGAQPEDQAQ